MSRFSILPAAALAALMLTTLPVAAVSLNLGGSGSVIDLGGSNSGTNANIGLSGDGLSVTTDGTADFNNDASVNLDLFGSPASANLTTGSASGSDSLLIDLFGAGGTTGTDTSADLSLGLDQLGTSGLLDLFGPSGSGVPAGGAAGGIGTTGGGSATASGGGIRIASLGDDEAACYSPDSGQMNRLMNRHTYNAATISSWRGVTGINVVEVGLCAEASQRLAALAAGDRNLMQLQSYIAGQPSIRTGLSAQGHSTSDVVAVDRDGTTLIVYVI